MRDREPVDLDTVRIRQETARAEVAARYAAERATPFHLAPIAIAACAMCDDDGYRPSGVVCDHEDHAAAAARGMAAVRDALKDR